MYILDFTRINPQEQTINLEGSVVIQCLSHTPAKWSFYDGHIPSNAQIEDDILSISSVNLENQGIYHCQGTSENGDIFWTESLLFVRSE